MRRVGNETAEVPIVRRGRGRARLVRLVLVSVLLGTLSVVAAEPTSACSIAEDLDKFASADAVFVGTARSFEPLGRARFGSDWLWDVEVEGVVHGDVAREQAVVSTNMGSCGWAISAPGRYLIVANYELNAADVSSSEPVLVATVFGGTHPLPVGVASDVGPLTAPREGRSGYPDGRRALTLPWLLAGIATAGLGGWFVVRRVRRVRSNRARSAGPAYD